ncbi:MAG: DegT/DnrJ/EryC1/StrS family aminotransferase [Pseudomonadota bacterium]
METFCALIRGDLAPAGNKILLAKDPDPFAYQLAGYHSEWVDSGTSALALALADAKAKAPHIKNPRVIIPGYCCPDLVAAAVYAGVKPLAVDIDSADASYNLNALKSALGSDASNSDIVAVIAVNFLGIKERLADIRAMLVNTHTKLIEDNAQWLPASAEQHDFSSDYILFSFGRGKPLSLLGGGVLFSKQKIITTALMQKVSNNSLAEMQQALKLQAFNMLLHPHLYCFLNRAPFLRLGETLYHPLTTISAMDSFRHRLFSANLNFHQSKNKNIEQAYDEICTASNIQQLQSLTTLRRQQLLRYPLLCSDANSRNNLLRKLNIAGLGGSPLYQQSIVEIPGISELIDVYENLNNAQQFAKRLLTLPTHEYVSIKHIQRIENIFRSVAR